MIKKIQKRKSQYLSVWPTTSQMVPCWKEFCGYGNGRYGMLALQTDLFHFMCVSSYIRRQNSSVVSTRLFPLDESNVVWWKGLIMFKIVLKWLAHLQPRSRCLHNAAPFVLREITWYSVYMSPPLIFDNIKHVFLTTRTISLPAKVISFVNWVRHCIKSGTPTMFPVIVSWL